MTEKQPKALRLADTFDHPLPPDWSDMQAASSELRRLHAENQELNHKLTDYASTVEHLLRCAHEEGAEIVRLKELRDKLLNILHAALPFVEDVNGNNVFKVARATAMAVEILEVIASNVKQEKPND